MVTGLEKFRKHFAGLEDCFVLIGGAASDIWMGKSGLDFRMTKDLDLVLIVEALRSEFFQRFWAFVKNGKYGSLQQGDERPEFYRFKEPNVEEYPFMIELLSRNKLDLPEGVHLTPIPVDEDISSLSAILLNDVYYAYVVETKQSVDGIQIVPAQCLIPLKARAYLDLVKRRDDGDNRVRSVDIKKHRYDVFRIYRTLAPAARHKLPNLPKTDLAQFLDTLPEESEEWTSIRKAVGAADLPDTSEILSQMTDIFELHR
ncbi:MAG: hypothetical protein E4H02_11905 [Lentisphaerales bacterium]|nr:MAG: hypothetical protein E4H02_11905 [Lentisphaerales bacterium]